MNDELQELKNEHRKLDTEIKKKAKHVGTDSLKLRALKQQKCRLKEKISRLEKPVPVAVAP